MHVFKFIYEIPINESESPLEKTLYMKLSFKEIQSNNGTAIIRENH